MTDRDALFARDPADEVTAAEAAAALRLDDDQIRVALDSGRLRHRVVDGERRITVAAVRAYEADLLRRRREGADAVTELSNELGLYE
jgi:hypothetical protein